MLPIFAVLYQAYGLIEMPPTLSPPSPSSTHRCICYATLRVSQALKACARCKVCIVTAWRWGAGSLSGSKTEDGAKGWGWGGSNLHTGHRGPRLKVGWVCSTRSATFWSCRDKNKYGASQSLQISGRTLCHESVASQERKVQEKEKEEEEGGREGGNSSYIHTSPSGLEVK